LFQLIFFFHVDCCYHTLAIVHHFGIRWQSIRHSIRQGGQISVTVRGGELRSSELLRS